MEDSWLGLKLIISLVVGGTLVYATVATVYSGMAG